MMNKYIDLVNENLELAGLFERISKMTKPLTLNRASSN